jgi:hypothetical protein
LDIILGLGFKFRGRPIADLRCLFNKDHSFVRKDSVAPVQKMDSTGLFRRQHVRLVGTCYKMVYDSATIEPE